MKNDAKKNRFFEMLKRGLTTFFTKNIALKVLSLVFAMLLWGYVLMTQNPVRVKTITNVSVSIEGEADLTTRKLIVRGDREELLKDVSVRVKTELTSYADLSAEDISASINLSGINTKGKHKLTISARTSTGQIVSISPSQIEVEVDALVTHRVPVEVGVEGELPQGYWAGDVLLDRSVIELNGAETDLAQIAKAVGTIDLAERTESINQSIMLTLLDQEGNEVDKAVLFGNIPTVIAKLEILPCKEVPIDVEGALIGKDALPENFEIVAITTSLNKNVALLVSDDEATLANITAISLETLDVTGLTESVQQELQLVVPEGVRLIGSSAVNLQVAIHEKTDTVAFAELPIDVTGLERNAKYTLSQELSGITLTGRVSLLAGITRGDIKVYADATGLAAGEHEVRLAITIDGQDLPAELTCVFATGETVLVTIE